MVSRCVPLRFWELWPSLLSKDPFIIPFHQLMDNRFDLHLEARIEYLTLAVANAKSHPISIGGRHETAIAFLTDLEEKLDVAQVQLEIHNTLLPHVNDAPEVGDRIKSLSTQLFTMTDVSQVQISSTNYIYCVLINYLSSTKSSRFHSTFLLSSCCASMFQNTVTRVSSDLFGIKYLTRVRSSIQMCLCLC